VANGSTPSEQIARVSITSGNSAIGPNDTNGDNDDVVVMDDFIYSEPIAVPEPTTAALPLASGAALALHRRRQRPYHANATSGGSGRPPRGGVVQPESERHAGEPRRGAAR
jgi:hypothetical protein